MKKLYASDLRHRLILCSQRDVMVSDGDLRQIKKSVIVVRAAIEQKNASSFNAGGAVVKESRDKQSHVIYFRYNHTLAISVGAWFYEERRKSPPRWFKILAVGQTEASGEEYFNLSCRLVSRGDELSEPTEATNGLAIGMPAGVVL